MSDKKSRKTPVRGTPEHFRAFLAAADRDAFALLLSEGVYTNENRERDAYEDAIESLAKQFVGPYDTTDLDDVCTFEELWAKMEAAYMLGMAAGMRLQAGEIVQALKGGAR